MFPEIWKGRYAYVCNQQYAWSGFDPPSSRAGFDTGSAQQVHGQAAGKRRRTSVLLRLLPEQHGAPDVGWAENMKHMQWFSGQILAYVCCFLVESCQILTFKCAELFKVCPNVGKGWATCCRRDCQLLRCFEFGATQSA